MISLQTCPSESIFKSDKKQLQKLKEYAQDMKRSEINKAIKELEAMCSSCCFALPPFCGFTPEEWQTLGHEYDEVRDCMLGWDITDYGLGDFDKVGMSLITIRNGNRSMADKYPKVYAEKLLYLREGQYSPNHFHIRLRIS